MDKHFFYELVNKWLDGKATPEEKLLVEAYWERLSSEDTAALSPEKKAKIKQAIYQGVIAQTHPATAAKVVPMHRRRWVRVAAASIIVAVLAGAGWLTIFNKTVKENLAGLPQSERYKNDIAPATQGVVLKLDNGKEIILDSTQNGAFTTEGNVLAKKADGSLAYEANNSEVFYHRIATNKGKDYHLTLADGTEVWLDAMSSIYFPTSFPGAERVVEVTGQVYFEVARLTPNPSPGGEGGKAKPFKVKVGGQVVEVLGTHFNINAHGGLFKTTLLEGSVKIGTAMLKPGQQAVAVNKVVRITSGVDTEEVMAWKNGNFRFGGASMEEVMMQLERWYDIDVDYADKINDVQLVGNIDRKEKISKILSLLEMTKEVEFGIEGKRVTVMKAKK